MAIEAYVVIGHTVTKYFWQKIKATVNCGLWGVKFFID